MISLRRLRTLIRRTLTVWHFQESNIVLLILIFPKVMALHKRIMLLVVLMLLEKPLDNYVSVIRVKKPGSITTMNSELTAILLLMTIKNALKVQWRRFPILISTNTKNVLKMKLKSSACLMFKTKIIKITISLNGLLLLSMICSIVVT